jgi:hypothetical protein
MSRKYCSCIISEIFDISTIFAIESIKRDAETIIIYFDNVRMLVARVGRSFPLQPSHFRVARDK